MAIEVNALDGQQVTGATLRLANFQGTNGGNGVLMPQDLRVRALDVPGNAVQVIRGPSGGASLVNPSTGAQAYVTHALGTEQVIVPATDSSGSKTRYIIQYIDTANNPGAWYACVDSLAAYAQIPHVVLARIDQPASTATITADLITDLRKPANPGSWPDMRTYPMTAGETDTLSNAQTYPAGQGFPAVVESAWAEVYIPERAVQAHILMTWGGVDTSVGDVSGYLWVQIGWSGHPDVIYTQGVRYHETTDGRKPLMSADTVTIPESMRGTAQKFYPRGNVLSESSAAARLEVNGGSVMVLQIMFVEVAE